MVDICEILIIDRITNTFYMSVLLNHFSNELSRNLSYGIIWTYAKDFILLLIPDDIENIVLSPMFLGGIVLFMIFKFLDIMYDLLFILLLQTAYIWCLSKIGLSNDRRFTTIPVYPVYYCLHSIYSFIAPDDSGEDLES